MTAAISNPIRFLFCRLWRAWLFALATIFSFTTLVAAKELESFKTKDPTVKIVDPEVVGEQHARITQVPSQDFESDTPEVLHAYREKMHLSTEHWTRLRGTPEEMSEFAAILGVNLRKDVRGQFMHSNLITVLISEGEVVHWQAGIRSEAQPIIAALDHTIKKTH